MTLHSVVSVGLRQGTKAKTLEIRRAAGGFAWGVVRELRKVGKALVRNEGG
jgi:hypothetical protein